MHVEKEGGAAADPALPIRRDATAGDDAMQMGVKKQILSPGVKDGEKTDLRAQMLGIAGNGEQSFGRGMEQNVVERFLVVISDSGNLFRQGEDDVEVRRRQ